MSKNKKRVLWLLLPILLLFGLLIGKRFANQRSLQEGHQETIPVSEQLQAEARMDSSAKYANEEMDSAVTSMNDGKDSISAVKKLTDEWPCPAQTVKPEVVDRKRKQTWEQTLKGINAELLHCHNWFDTVEVLSTWLYQNTRVGDVSRYNIDRVIGRTYVLSRLDLKYLYEVNNSDSVVGTCGFHGYYAVLLYDHFGIKSYCFSMRPNPNRKKSADGHQFATIAVGHMINVLENPHNKKWYPVDHFFGIRYRYKGEWLDMEKYFQLSRQQALTEVSIETFGAFKFRIQDSPCVPFNSWGMDSLEIVAAEPGNDPNYFRIVAPYTLKQQFSIQFKELFDPIAASFNQPPHVDWIDLARRMPLYGTRLFPLLDLKEQIYADTLLSSWKK